MAVERSLQDPALSAALAEVKARLTIAEVLAAAGIRAHRMGPARLRVSCPFHDDRDPSLVVYQQENRFYCFGCGRRGDVVDLVAALEGHETFLDALRAAAARAAVALPERPVPPDPRAQLFDAAISLYSGLLTPQAVQYLGSRGFPEPFVRAKQIGYAPERPKAFLAGQLRARGLSLREAEAAGLVVRAAAGGAVRDAFAAAGGGYLVFPVRKAGRVVDLQGRAWPESPGKPKYLNLPGERRHLYGEDQLGGDWALLCEGIPDALSAELAGLPAAAVFGVRAFRESFVAKFRRCRRIYVCFDRDATERAADVASLFGVRGRVVQLPGDLGPHGDLNDLLVRCGSAERLRRELEPLLQQAPTGYAVRIDALRCDDPLELYAQAAGLLVELHRLDPISRVVHLQRLSERTGVTVSVLENAAAEAAAREAELARAGASGNEHGHESPSGTGPQ
jgi:DNA primase